MEMANHCQFRASQRFSKWNYVLVFHHDISQAIYINNGLKHNSRYIEYWRERIGAANMKNKDAKVRGKLVRRNFIIHISNEICRVKKNIFMIN